MSAEVALSRTLLLAKDAQLMGDNVPTDEQILGALRDTTVVLVADEANLRSAAGQHALVALFTLVARLGVTMRLAIPEVPVLDHQPPLRQGELRAGLLQLGGDLIPDRFVELVEPHVATDIAFIFGDTPWIGHAGLALRLCGNEWSGWTLPTAAANAPTQQPARWSGRFPIGALTAAGIAAPEAFKLAMHKLAPVPPSPMVPRFLVPVDRTRVAAAPPSTRTGPFELGEVDFVSGGAITNAALFTLLHLPELSATFRVIEPECHDLSNLNRYPLLRRSESQSPKVDILTQWRRAGVQIGGITEAYTITSRDRILPLAPSVLVGTDDIPARWAVQREWPRWLGVGATSHFSTVTSSHTPEQPCAGCLHPTDDPNQGTIPTISFVSYWAGLLLAVRLLRHSLGYVYAGVDQSLWSSPLRLDQPRAYWPTPVAVRQDCPVQCAASVSQGASR